MKTKKINLSVYRRCLNLLSDWHIFMEQQIDVNIEIRCFNVPGHSTHNFVECRQFFDSSPKIGNRHQNIVDFLLRFTLFSVCVVRPESIIFLSETNSFETSFENNLFDWRVEVKKFIKCLLESSFLPSRAQLIILC